MPGPPFALLDSGVNISLNRGDSRDIAIEVRQGDDVLPSALDLTGKDLEFTARRQPDDAVVVTKATTGIGLVVTDAAQGLALLSFMAGDLITLEGQTVVLDYDLELIDGTKRYTLRSGALIVQADITVAPVP